MPRRMQDKNRQNGGRTGQRTVFINGLEKSISYFRQAVFYGHSKSVKDNRGYNDKLQYLIDGLKISNSKSSHKISICFYDLKMPVYNAQNRWVNNVQNGKNALKIMLLYRFGKIIKNIMIYIEID